MSCYCGATRMAPCAYCESSYECGLCGLLCHPDKDGANGNEEKIFCDKCDHHMVTALGSIILKVCECGKDKFNFFRHSTWCNKYS